MRLIMKVCAGVLVFVATLALVTPAYAVIIAGTYTGSGSIQRIQTGLTTIRAVTIVSLPEHGPSVQGYTTDAIQMIGQGTFVNGNKKDTGIAFDVGNIVVISPDFIQQGVIYGWEARGD